MENNIKHFKVKKKMIIIYIENTIFKIFKLRIILNSCT